VSPRGKRRPLRLGAARPLRGLLIQLLAAVLLLAPRAGRADERRSHARGSQLVVVDYAGSAFTDPALYAAVRELLSRIQVQVVSPLQSASGNVIAYAHIVIGADAVKVSVEDARGQNAPVRRSVPRGDSDAMLRETVGHVLLGLVEPLAEASRLAASPQALHDGEDARGSRRATPQLGLHGGPVQLGQDCWSGRFVASGAFVWGGPLEPSIALDANMAVPVSVHGQGVEARVLLAGARARVRITALALAHAALDAALGVGADVISMRPESATAGTELSSSSRRGQPVVGVALGARARLHPQVELVLGIGVDLDLQPRRWSVEEGGATSSVFETRYVRPYATLGVDWQLQAQPRRP
jgi:hypothetical protein